MIPTSLRVVVADDSGPSTPDGDSIDNDFVQSLQDAVDASANNQIPISVTSTQNNYAPTGFDAAAGHCTFPWAGSADATFTGFATGSAGQRITFINNTSAKVMYFAHASGSSSSGKKFTNMLTSAQTPVAPGGRCTYEYDTSSGTGVWNLIAHEQGAFVPFTPVLAFGGASVGITYGASKAGEYCVSGRTVHVQVRITLTAKGSSTGSATVTGLPITLAGTPGSAVGSILDCEVGMGSPTPFTGIPYAQPSLASTTVLLSQTSGTNRANLTDVNFSSTSDFWFSLWYQAA